MSVPLSACVGTASALPAATTSTVVARRERTARRSRRRRPAQPGGRRPQLGSDASGRQPGAARQPGPRRRLQRRERLDRLARAGERARRRRRRTRAGAAGAAGPRPRVGRAAARRRRRRAVPPARGRSAPPASGRGSRPGRSRVAVAVLRPRRSATVSLSPAAASRSRRCRPWSSSRFWSSDGSASITTRPRADVGDRREARRPSPSTGVGVAGLRPRPVAGGAHPSKPATSGAPPDRFRAPDAGRATTPAGRRAAASSRAVAPHRRRSAVRRPRRTGGRRAPLRGRRRRGRARRACRPRAEVLVVDPAPDRPGRVSVAAQQLRPGGDAGAPGRERRRARRGLVGAASTGVEAAQRDVQDDHRRARSRSSPGRQGAGRASRAHASRVLMTARLSDTRGHWSRAVCTSVRRRGSSAVGDRVERDREVVERRQAKPS